MAFVCLHPDCTRETFNGQPDEYCSFTCRRSIPHCAQRGCSKPTCDRQEGSFCEDHSSGQSFSSSWCGNQAGSKASQPSASSQQPQAGRWEEQGEDLSYDCLEGDKYNEACCDQPPQIARCPENGDRYREASQYFQKKWQPELWNGPQSSVPLPSIAAIYELTYPVGCRRDFIAKQESMRHRKKKGPHAGPGNCLRRFHGTRMMCVFNGTPCADPACFACRIVEEGMFQIGHGESSGTACYGDGIYFTSMSHTAKGYGLARGKAQPPQNLVDFIALDAGNAVFIADVLAGRVDKIKAEGFAAGGAQVASKQLDSKCDSLCVEKSTGNDELVIFQPNQARPKWLIVFNSTRGGSVQGGKGAHSAATAAVSSAVPSVARAVSMHSMPAPAAVPLTARTGRGGTAAVPAALPAWAPKGKGRSAAAAQGRRKQANFYSRTQQLHSARYRQPTPGPNTTWRRHSMGSLPTYHEEDYDPYSD